MGDWPENDALTASMSNSTTTVTVADSTLYAAGWVIQVDTEAMYVRSLPTATTLTVLRGVRGTTAASHASATTVLIRPHFLDLEYLDALNAAIEASFPWLYQETVDESITTASGTYEYDVPASIPYLSEIEFQETGDLAFRPVDDWDVKRGATPFIKLRRDLPEGTLRVRGFGPFSPLTSTTDSLSTQFPVRAEDALLFYTAQYLLASGEARRVREDTGARDDRDWANRPGSSLQISNTMLTRFQLRLRDAGMPPLPKHVKSVI